jgi:hypothetical protein
MEFDTLRSDTEKELSLITRGCFCVRGLYFEFITSPKVMIDIPANTASKKRASWQMLPQS